MHAESERNIIRLIIMECVSFLLYIRLYVYEIYVLPVYV